MNHNQAKRFATEIEKRLCELKDPNVIVEDLGNGGWSFFDPDEMDEPITYYTDTESLRDAVWRIFIPEWEDFCLFEDEVEEILRNIGD